MANASNTIESIKRQLQNMKTQKEDAFDRAEKADVKLAELLDRRSKVNKTKSKKYFVLFFFFLILALFFFFKTNENSNKKKSRVL